MSRPTQQKPVEQFQEPKTMRCPRCGNDDAQQGFEETCVGVFKEIDGALRRVGGTSLDNANRGTCCACGFKAKVSEFDWVEQVKQ